MKSTFPEIETERLFLNQPGENDVDSIVQILNNPIYSENTINIPFPYSKDNARFWLGLAEEGFKNENHYIFSIRLNEDKEFVGAIGLGIDKTSNKAELGYWIGEKYWNRGYATEAVQAIIKFGFENLNLKRIFASVFDFNPASGQVLVKSGMEKEGLLKCHTLKNGVYQNHIFYAIINE